ncbi:MarR family winged helix-turn-helix transcriptional regulator [Lentzea flava]|uniref:Transcriptional regulator n=1 Tax=Lentzea flava TaxID=103732 RepID=A0ABQ2UPX9_9PSEU|nr:MarR family transcriptional regulator [Lentzea flava]MCP2200081.1 DNA-binding transcriptional regulator, MarR family [Lentzea flava]GGU45983.1 transcriptional regulator [Lentzea flava]
MSTDASEVYRRYVGAMVLHGLHAARSCGLGGTDLYALNLLDLNGPMTPGELSAQTGLTTGPTTRLIDRLEEAGFVRRTPSPDDRRKVIVELLAEPAPLAEALAPAREKLGDIFAGYSEEERRTLFDYFARATEALRP